MVQHTLELYEYVYDQSEGAYITYLDTSVASTFYENPNNGNNNNNNDSSNSTSSSHQQQQPPPPPVYNPDSVRLVVASPSLIQQTLCYYSTTSSSSSTNSNNNHDNDNNNNNNNTAFIPESILEQLTRMKTIPQSISKYFLNKNALFIPIVPSSFTRNDSDYDTTTSNLLYDATTTIRDRNCTIHDMIYGIQTLNYVTSYYSTVSYIIVPDDAYFLLPQQQQQQQHNTNDNDNSNHTTRQLRTAWEHMQYDSGSSSSSNDDITEHPIRTIVVPMDFYKRLYEITIVEPLEQFVSVQNNNNNNSSNTSMTDDELLLSLLQDDPFYLNNVSSSWNVYLEIVCTDPFIPQCTNAGKHSTIGNVHINNDLGNASSNQTNTTNSNDDSYNGIDPLYIFILGLFGITVIQILMFCFISEYFRRATNLLHQRTNGNTTSNNTNPTNQPNDDPTNNNTNAGHEHEQQQILLLRLSEEEFHELPKRPYHECIRIKQQQQQQQHQNEPKQCSRTKQIEQGHNTNDDDDYDDDDDDVHANKQQSDINRNSNNTAINNNKTSNDSRPTATTTTGKTTSSSIMETEAATKIVVIKDGNDSNNCLDNNENDGHTIDNNNSNVINTSNSRTRQPTTTTATRSSSPSSSSLGVVPVVVGDVCSICVEEFDSNELVLMLPRCSHIYHISCIEQWLLQRQSYFCPVCKLSVKELPVPVPVPPPQQIQQQQIEQIQHDEQVVPIHVMDDIAPSSSIEPTL